MKFAIHTTLIALFVFASFARAQQAEDPWKQIVTYKIEDSRRPAALIEEEIRNAPAAEYPAIEAKVLAALASPQATTDAKIVLCRQLVLVGSAKCVAPVAALLADEKVSHAARMALQVNPDASAAAALRTAATQLKGKLQAGVVGSIGARHDAQAVTTLATLVADANADVAHNAIQALGLIGTVDALKSLENAKVAESNKQLAADAKLTCARQLAASGNADEALRVYKSLSAAADMPAIRVAAFRSMLAAMQANQAVETIVSTIQGNDADLVDAALAVVVSSSKAVRDGVAAQIPAFKAEAQKAVIGLVVDQPDTAARAALLKVLETSADAEVRALALQALAVHGEAGDVAMLIKLAAGATADKDNARKALEQMRNAGANQALIAALASADASATPVILGILATRRVEEAVPAITKLLGTPNTAEAAKALSTLGTPVHLPALAALIAENNDAAVRDAAANAAKAICNRATDKDACSKAVLPALDGAKSPAARVALLQVLTRIGNADALAAVVKAMEDKDAAIRDAAIRELADWPDIAAGAALMKIAKSATDQKYSILALRGAMRLAGMKDKPSAARVALYRDVLSVAQRPEEKKQALAGLAQVPAIEAIELLQPYAKDEALGPDAQQAIIRLARQVGVVYGERAQSALREVLAQAKSDDVKREASAALKLLQNAAISPDGFILAWVVAGPFMQQDKTGDQLLDVAFDPEKSIAQADWRPISADGRKIVDLGKAIGGNQRVAYLHVQLISEKAQDAMLELGSDDGIKVLVNGKSVLAKNVVRPVTPGQDKVKISLKQGPNTLLLKVIQVEGDWGACARLRSASGGEIVGVTVSPAVK